MEFLLSLLERQFRFAAKIAGEHASQSPCKDMCCALGSSLPIIYLQIGYRIRQRFHLVIVENWISISSSILSALFERFRLHNNRLKSLSRSITNLKKFSRSPCKFLPLCRQGEYFQRSCSRPRASPPPCKDMCRASGSSFCHRAIWRGGFCRFSSGPHEAHRE